MKKKYIQACELGGSIYGKRHPSQKRSTLTEKEASQKKNLISIYSSFYKRQAETMSRMFRDAE